VRGQENVKSREGMCEKGTKEKKVKDGIMEGRCEGTAVN
jgi:hypothetical protein